LLKTLLGVILQKKFWKNFERNKDSLESFIQTNNWIGIKYVLKLNFDLMFGFGFESGSNIYLGLWVWIWVQTQTKNHVFFGSIVCSHSNYTHFENKKLTRLICSWQWNHSQQLSECRMTEPHSMLNYGSY